MRVRFPGWRTGAPARLSGTVPLLDIRAPLLVWFRAVWSRPPAITAALCDLSVDLRKKLKNKNALRIRPSAGTFLRQTFLRTAFTFKTVLSLYRGSDNVSYPWFSATSAGSVIRLASDGLMH